MWDVLVRTPRGSNNPRKFSLLLTMFFMACFAYIFASAPPVYAANATWKGDNIVYNGATYTPLQSSDSLPSEVKASPAIYQYVDDSQNPDLVYFIYFADEVRIAKSAKEATYIRYTLNPPNDDYINPTDKQTIALTPVEAGETADTDDGTVLNTCTIDSIGWLVCPLMNGTAEGMDFIFNRIRAFLEVQPITTSVDNPIYRIWSYSRDLANIAFVLGFMVIIYSYLVGGGFNGYEIRKILPRLVMAAILINISYVICAAAVDISNIAGYGVNQLFENVRDEVLPGSQVGSTNWTSVTAWVLAGGVGVGAGAAILPGAIGGAVGGLWFMLAPFLLGAALLVMVTFLILAARQAIIIILIAIAPLAFAAFILPNTEKWFERWRSLFFTMLIMFPAFGAVFGGAQLAGEVIIRTATNIEQIILGLGVMVAPLAITPLLLKLGGGVLNRFGGIVNNPRKGIYDRYKNYNRDRLGEHVAKNNATNAALLASGGFKRRQFMRRRAAYDYSKKNYREEQKKQDEESAANSWHRQTGRWGYDNHQDRDSVQSRLTRRPQNGYGNLDTYKRDNHLYHGQTEAHHEEHWQQLLNTDPSRRAMLTDTRLSENRGKVLSGAMEAQDDRTFQTALNTDGAYANLRNMKVQTSVDTGVADVHKAAVESAGKLALSTTVSGDRDLRKMKVQSFENEKRSETIDNTLKKNAEANWNNISKNDTAVQELRLREIQATDQAKVTEARFDRIVADAKANGASARVAAQNAGIAQSIQSIASDIVIEEKTTGALNTVAQSNAERRYVESTDGRALNIRSQVAQDGLEYAKAEETAIIQEWRTKKGAENLTGESATLAAALREADYEKRVETQRAGAAKRLSDIEYAVDVTEVDANGTPTAQAMALAQKAGGVEGETGATQARAVAFQTIVDAQNKGVAAARTLLSRVDNDDLLGDGPNGLAAANILDRPTEHISAIASTIAGRMHQKSHIRLWDQMAVLHKQAADMVQAAEAAGDADALADAKDKLGKIKDLQQQVMADKKRTPFGAGDRDQGQATTGDYEGNIYESTRDRILTHMSGKRLSETDPDDLRLIFEMARAGKLGDAHVRKLAEAYKQWSEDDNLKSSIEDKHRALLEPIKAYAETGSISNIPGPGSPPPTGFSNANYWDSQYTGLDTKIQNP